MGFGNKGAVMVRMRVFDEPLCCICAHIASGETPADALKRQADFMHICKTANFSEPAADNPNYIVHEPLEQDVTCASVLAPHFDACCMFYACKYRQYASTGR
jgi:hypothetical protein